MNGRESCRQPQTHFEIRAVTSGVTGQAEFKGHHGQAEFALADSLSTGINRLHESNTEVSLLYNNQSMNQSINQSMNQSIE